MKIAEWRKASSDQSNLPLSDAPSEILPSQFKNRVKGELVLHSVFELGGGGGGSWGCDRKELDKLYSEPLSPFPHTPFDQMFYGTLQDL